jgi:hypothetical protein
VSLRDQGRESLHRLGPLAACGRAGGVHLDDEGARGRQIPFQHAQIAVEGLVDELAPRLVRPDPAGDRRDHGCGEVLVGRQQARLLVSEVLVERRARDRRSTRQLADRDGGVTALGEQLGEGGHQPCALRRGDLRAAQPVRSAGQRGGRLEDRAFSNAAHRA